MKKQQLITFSLLTLLFIVSTSSKYEKGPFISFLSKKYRIARTWNLDSYVSSKGEVDTDVAKSTFTFKKDLTGTANFIYDKNTSKNEFKWKFSDDKKYIYFISDDDFYKEKILRLTRKELWLEDSDGDCTKFKSN